MSEVLVNILSACVPIAVALVGIIPTIIANRKKTEDSLHNFQADTRKTLNKLSDDVDNLKNDVNLIKDDLSSAKEDIKGLREDLNNHVTDDEEMQQKQRRVRIIRFADEIRDGVAHTDDHWDEIDEDINRYELYCETHKGYKNNKGKISMNFVKEMYAARLHDKNFKS